MIDRARIADLIPHGGAMVLLDQVLSHDAQRIHCSTVSHLKPDNPLRLNDKLPAVCGAEYGAQAAAVHGALTSPQILPPGQVVLLRQMTWSRPFLDEIGTAIDVEAERLHQDARNLAYGFVLSAEGQEVLRGECGIILS